MPTEILYHSTREEGGYLPQPDCEVENDPANVGMRMDKCGLACPGRPGWFCTRAFGHDGDHMAVHKAWKGGVRVFARWRVVDAD